jgi:quercetin dioxygenase-like cupin family protein
MDGYEVVDTEDVPRMDMGELLDGLLETDARRITAALGAGESVISVWYFEPGESMPHHAHNEQEEVFYVLEGEFEVVLGPAEDVERKTIGPGSFYAAGPGVYHGHRYLGEDEGQLLAIGAPNVNDINPDTWTPVEEL